VTLRSRTVGVVVACALGALAAFAPLVAPHLPSEIVDDYAFAPPMRPHLVDDDGRWHAPFVYRVQLANRLEKRFAENRAERIPIRWFTGGRLVSSGSATQPLFLLGGDPSGRDVCSRLLAGARISLGVALVASAAALLVGALIGALSGFAGGRVDLLLMRIADFVIVLPAIYIVLTLRAAMPLVMEPWQIFWTTVGVLATAGWPIAARGVRAIVGAERHKEYAESARASGAGPWRILLRHLLPASRGYLAVQATLLMPAFVIAEATLSFVGLGFPETTPSWGVMLRDAQNLTTLTDAPWLLAPAAAIVISVFVLHLLADDEADPTAFAAAE
jgi:peptide/nickel transport system permease protein